MTRAGKIVDVVSEGFHFRSHVVRDSDGHTHPGPEHDATQQVLKIITDAGAEGYAFGAAPEAIRAVVKPFLLGQDPFDRERLWQGLREAVGDVGGITPLLKTAHLCESFGIRLEVHGGGAGNLQALCAMGIPGQYYERGLLHPFLDYERPAPWLNTLDDPMDEQGDVHVSSRPGLGQDINWDYIREHAVGRG